jgi:hypothetical protein
LLLGQDAEHRNEHVLNPGKDRFSFHTVLNAA